MKTTKQVWLNCIQLLTLIFLSVSASAQLKADFAASPQIGCPPMVVNFQDKSTGGPTSWKWDLGNGTISYLQSPIATYFNPGTYTVKLIVKNVNGEDSIARSQFIVVNELPKTNFSASDTTGCFPLKVTFKDSSIAGSGTIASWQWDFGDGNLSTLQNPVHTYVNAGSFTVTLTVRNSNGCVKVFTRPAYIKLTTGVQADFSFDVPSGCKSPTVVNFTNKSTGTGILTYNWSFGNGSTSALTNPSASYLAAGKFTIRLIALNSAGCTDTLVKTDVVNISFVKATFSSDDKVCVNKPLTLTNTSSPLPVSAFWDFGDGTTSTSISAVKQFSKAGTYVVKLVNTYTMCADSVTKTVTVYAGPVVGFDATNLTGCKIPHTVNFTNTSLGGVSYLWNFGDGTGSTWQTPNHTYTSYGNFAVTLVVTNANGCKDSLVKNQYVKVIAPKINAISGVPAKGCIPYTINPVAVVSSNQAITGYKWDFGDGITSIEANPAHTYTVAGAYTVKLIVTTAEGCTDTLVVKDGVKAGTKPGTAFMADPVEVCAQTKVDFTDMTSSATFIHEWSWQFGDGGTSVMQNPSHQYTDTGRFDVTLVTTNFGCSDTLFYPKYINVKPPIARFDTAFLCTDPLKRDFLDKSLAATAWTWDFGDGTSSNLQFPSHTYAAPGNYKVSLKVSNGSCEHSTSKFVRLVNEKPRLLATDSTSCRNARMTFTVTNVIATNINNYTWYPMGAATTAPIVTPLYALAQYYTQPGPVSPYVIVQDVLGCNMTVATTAPISVYGPTAGFSVPFTSTCSVTAVPFNDTSSTDGVHPISKYIWSYGDGKIDTAKASPFVHQYDSAGVFSVRLTIIDNYGCRDSVYKLNLLTISKPAANFTASDTLVCPNVPVVFTNQSIATNPTYLWSFGDGATSTLVSPSHAYASEGDYKVSLTLSDKYSCNSTLDTLIHVVQTKAAFLMSDSFSSCPPLLVDFTNKSKGYTVMSYDFGDGGISTLNNPSHIYTYPGTYFVKLGVRNNGGCTDTLVQKIVIQGPTGTFTYNPLIVCNPGKVDFVATTKNSVKYVWDYNDGTTVFSPLTSTSHVYDRPGIYVPKIILEDNSGCRVPVVGKDTIKVSFVATHIIAAKSVLCDSGFVALKDSSLSNDVYQSFTWSFGDGKTATGRNVTHHYNATGWYNVKLVTKTESGCIDSASVNNLVKVVNSPKINIISDTSSCLPGMLTFSGGLLHADTSTLKWQWNFGNGQVATIQNPVRQIYNTVGKFDVKAVVVNYDGCKDSTTRYINIHPIPVINAGKDTTICNGNSIALQATGAAQYTWSFDPSLSCLNCDKTVAKPSTSKAYVVTGKTVFGCTSTDTVLINVTQPFKMKVNSGDTLCVGQSFTLGASGAEVYQWTPALWLNNATSASPVAKPDSTITYRVIGNTANSCFADTGFVTVKVYPIPQLDILGSDIVTVNVGSSYQMEIKSSKDIKQWKWMPSTWLSCADCPNPLATPKESRVYAVVGINEGSCVARAQVTINLVCNNANVFIPNTFSPKNDGNNDRFYPRGNGVFGIKSMKVFNRWGQIVFQNNSFTPNNASSGWDGKLQGVDLPPDVYIYIMDVICENSAVIPIKGNVTLVR